MTREDKIRLVDDLAEEVKETDHFYITDASGLTVAEVNKFRERCFAKGVKYRVVKNSLIKKALEHVEGDFSDIDGVLKGMSGMMFVNENASVPAKIIRDFKKGDAQERPKFKAASIGADLFVGEDKLRALVNLKSRQELIGDVVSLLQSPAKNVLALLQSGEQKLAGIVKTLSERRE